MRIFTLDYKSIYEDHIGWRRYKDELRYKSEFEIKCELNGVIQEISIKEGSYFHDFKEYYLVVQTKRDPLQRRLYEIEVQREDCLFTALRAWQKEYKAYKIEWEKIKVEQARLLCSLLHH